MVNRFQKIDRLSNRQLWISRAVKGSLSAWCLCFQKDNTSTTHVFCRKRHVCAGLRRLAARRSANITQTFFDATSLFAPEGRAGRSRQNAKIKKRKIRNFKNCKSQKSKSRKLSSHFFREINREVVCRKIVFLFFLRSTARPSLLRLLPHHWQCARCILNASKQCPYEATTSTRLHSHVVRSEPRRTQ